MSILIRSIFPRRSLALPRAKDFLVRLWIIVTAIGILAARPTPALASQVRIPLTIDYIALREALKRKLYTAPGGRAPLWNGIDDCQFLYAENPEFSRAGSSGAGTVKLETANSLGLGVGMAGRCLSAVQWSGIVEALGVPYIAPGLQLKFHFTDLNVYDSAHQKTQIVSQAFDLIKSYLVPRLDDFSYDLNPAVQQLGSMLGDSMPPEAAARLHSAIASLTAEPDIVALDEGVRVTLVMQVPDFPTPTAVPGAAASPTPTELKAFQDTLDQWDAFLVFSIKQLGDAVGDQQFRDELLKILLDSRYRLVQALNEPAQNAGPDPVRVLFLDEWRQLHDAVRAAARRGMLGAHALEFMSFISAGDALFALDQAAPALGMRISAADLRRLAHIMAPGASGDPLQFNYREDRDLKKIFAVPEPPASHRPIEEENVPPSSPEASPRPAGASTPTAANTPSATPSPSGSTSSPTPGPSARLSRDHLARVRMSRSAPPHFSPRPLDCGRGRAFGAGEGAFTGEEAERSEVGEGSAIEATFLRLLSLLSPRDAAAAEETVTIPRLQDVADRLYRLVVNEDNAEDYRHDMGLLLDLSAEHELGEGGVDADNGTMYVTLVRATAWQESCWRQFVMAGERIRWLESATGDIGLMQVNKHVWRGFYDIERLKWDVLYNAGAGCEILARMMRYAMAQPKFDPVPVAGHLARSTYAAYNGGPGASNRWRRGEPTALKQIDSGFWDRYREVENGTPIDILSCARDWSHARTN
jgi:hypothetical protein